VRRRRDRPDQRPAGEQTEPRRLRPVPQGVRAGRQTAHDRRPRGRQGAAASAAPETEKTGTADAAAGRGLFLLRRVHGRHRKASS